MLQKLSKNNKLQHKKITKTYLSTVLVILFF